MMVEIQERQDPSGQWMKVRDDAEHLASAYLPPSIRPRDLTVMWSGKLLRKPIRRFCGDARDLMGERSWQPVLKGRCFVRGRDLTFTGEDWLKSLDDPAGQLLRLEYVQLPRTDDVSKTPGSGTGFTVWAFEPGQGEVGAEPEENLGVCLPSFLLERLEDQIAVLMSATQLSWPDVGRTRRIIRAIVRHLASPQPRAA